MAKPPIRHTSLRRSLECACKYLSVINESVPRTPTSWIKKRPILHPQNLRLVHSSSWHSYTKTWNVLCNIQFPQLYTIEHTHDSAFKAFRPTLTAFSWRLELVSTSMKDRENSRKLAARPVPNSSAIKCAVEEGQNSLLEAFLTFLSRVLCPFPSVS